MSKPTHNQVRSVKPGLKIFINLLNIAPLAAALYACATTSSGEGSPTAADLDTMGQKAVATLLASKPEAQEALDESVGHVVISMTSTKVPWFGAGGGYGVVVDKRTSTRSYIKVSRFEIGGGYGAQKYKFVIVFSDEKLLQRAAKGTWHYEAGAEVAAGSASTETGAGSDGGKGVPTKSGKGYKAYRLAEGGAVATVTVRLAYAKPYLAGD